MNSIKRITILSLILAAPGSPALADHPTISLEKGTPGPITTGSAVPLPKGVATATIQSQFIFNDELSNTVLEKASLLDEDVHSSKSVTSVSAKGAYGLTDNITLGFALPYLWRNDIREAGHHDEGEGEAEEDHHEDDEAEAGVAESLGDSTGLGDLTLFGQFQFFGDAASDTHLSLLAGLKTPTGRTDARAVNGEIFETELQPGSGSWDPIVGLAITQQAERFSFDASALYVFATEGTQDTNLGDILNYNLAVSYRVSGSPASAQVGQGDASDSPVHDHHGDHHHGLIWDLILEANGDWREQAKKSGTKDGNTGGNLVYLSFGTRVGWGHGWSITASAGIPILKDLNGIQGEPDARVLVGLSKVF